MTGLISRTRLLLLVAAGCTFASAANADSRNPATPAPPAATYADLVDLADGTPLVVRAQIRKAVPVEPERARGLRAGWIRAYVEARTEAVIGGNRALGEQLAYLVDVKADAKGKLPALKKKAVILFARPVDARPAELQLVAPDAQLPWDAATEARVKGVLSELYASGAPQKITGVREALHVPGNLAGAGETQLFLGSASGEPAAITVSRMPGRDAAMNVSFSELVGAGSGLPARETLAWYRLACFLPASLPAGANIGEVTEDRAAAALDYRAVIERLGPCERARR
ncbi:hypothetical protein [Novosphingobium sp.]|uniref:hypothetical protein n=1 Tax=Novosphingobium sp. TaxID=1874826 RepID=UPI00260101E6|nr:hypothetical protein [Novosphingobium sp.]